MRLLNFSKMQACGNDFMVINTDHDAWPLTTALIQHLADRHYGVGFDQLLSVSRCKDDTADFNYHIYNADGQRVTQCGNGARCIGRYLVDQQLSEKTQLRLKTDANYLDLTVHEQQVSVDLGQVAFAPEKIPLLRKAATEPYSIRFNEQTIEFHALSLGNPHAVFKLDDINTAPVADLGQFMNQLSDFPQGVNVSFMQVIDKHNIKLRVYERGVGETLACGSGAAAAAITACRLSLCANPINVRLPGGNVLVTWYENTKRVSISGEAHWVFNGQLDLQQFN